MKQRLIYIFPLLSLIANCQSWAQTNALIKENIIERFIETISENSEQEIDFTALTEDLYYYFDNPINLNQTTEDELKRLYLLSEHQINALLTYIEKHGKLLSIYEIQLLSGWNDETIYAILPFVDVQPVKEKSKLKFKNIFRYGKHEIVTRYTRIIEPAAGFLMNNTNDTKGYLGDPSQVFFRYRFTYKDRVSLGLVAKKDRGEEFFTGTQPYGFDFYGAHLFIKDLGPFKKIALGDYNLQFGQGLTMWTGFGYRRTAMAMNIKRFPSGIKPCSATNQAFFNRGLAAEAGIGPVSITGFISFKPRSVSVSQLDTLDGDVLEFSSLDETGLHRTLTEVNKKNRIYELIAGGNVTFKKRKWNIGITSAYTYYTASLTLSDAPYNRYRFQGNQLFNIGVDYNILLGKFYLFGELAFSGNGGHAFLQGVQAQLSNDFSLALLIRDYAPSYQNMNNNAFGDRSQNENERGVYLGFSAIPAPKWTITGYVDVFQFPWLRYNVDAPSFGYECLLQATFVPNRKTEIYTRIRRSSRQENSVLDDEYTDPLVHVDKTHYRLNFTYEVNSQLKLRSRMEFVTLERADKPFRWGMLAYQDIVYKPAPIRLDISARLAFFHTDDFDTRLYAYENDVLYSFSVPAYYNKGMRFYIHLKYEIIPGFSISCRVAQSYFANQKTIGSGLDLIDGNTRTEIKAQLRYRFGVYRKKKLS
ncbi:MAG: helix-hairpin-helix domain-containing protein [Candidatus Competibacteraceae bacterium]|nr:helix-hairpin-helix domain-containing protein [Candidatus Competibacteraceae bacterium]